MPFVFRSLDSATRERMVLEFDDDLAADRLYLSPRLTAPGASSYPELLRQALAAGDCDSFAEALRAPGVLKTREFAKNPRGGAPIEKAVPRTAPETLAEGEFNRFYARGLCRLVLETDEAATVLIYRARESVRPRPDSERLIGTRVPARQLLEDLREHVGVDTALGLPAGPNSGISICID